MAALQRRPGRHKTRRLNQPRGIAPARKAPGALADALTVAHNDAVQAFGSDSGGYLAFDPTTSASAGVWDGQGGFPANTVVTRLAWGFIDPTLAQRILEADKVE